MYDPTAAFSITNGNPNGAWSYGWMSTSFTGFTLYANAGMGNSVNPQWYGWGGNWTPGIWRNDGGLTSGGQQPGWLHLHPGDGTQPSVLRWTATKPGSCVVTGQYLAGDSGTMLVGVRQNTNWLWQGTNAGVFICATVVAIGDTIDFLVYGGYGSGTTPLRAILDGPAQVVTRYVDAASATPVAPYTNWATAATRIQDAVALSEDYDVVLVRAGTYAAGGASTAGGALTSRVCATTRVTVRAVDGPAVTTIRGASDGGGTGPNAVRCAYLAGGARLEGFTLEGGFSAGAGAAVDLVGGGACVVSGTLARCVARACSASAGGGLYLAADGVAENCLAVSNRVSGSGGGAYVAGGRLDHCTIAGNTADSSGGGVFLSGGGTLRNGIVYGNSAPASGNWTAPGGGTFANVCTTPTNGLPGASGCIGSDPSFLDAARGNYRLPAASPCVDGAPALAGLSVDLEGLPRSRDGDGNGFDAPDLGCYERFFTQPLLAVEDEQGRLYTAVWNPASSRFDALVNFTKIRGPDFVAANCRAVVLGDYDGDGDTDLVAARYGGSNRTFPFLFRNAGTNTFVETDTLGLHGESAAWSMDLAEGDFDGDGFLDLLSGGDDGTVGVFLGDGTGRFRQRILLSQPSQSRGLDAADFDHDGNLDFARAIYSAGYVYLYRGQGDGTFAAPVLLADVGDDPYAVTAGDFDGDGHPDLLANAGSSGDAYFFKGTGAGTFSNPVYVGSLDVNRHSAWDAYDFNGDGRLDVVSVDYDGRTVRFFPGLGNGAFTTAVTVGTTYDNAMAIAAPSLAPPAGTPQPAVAPAVTTAAVGQAVALDGGASADPGGALVSNRWDFGDGARTDWSNGAPATVSHAYAAPGRYTVRLRVLDSSGWQAVAAARVVVTGAPPATVAAQVILPESSATRGWYPATLLASNFVTAADGSRRHWAPAIDYTADFEAGSSTGWDFRSGTWSVSTGSAIAGSFSLRQDDTSLDRAYACLNLPIEGDAVVECDAKFIGGSGQELIIALAIDDTWSGFNEVIWRGRGLNDVLIGQYGSDTFSRQLDYVPQLGTSYHLRVVYRRGFAEAWVGTNYLGGARAYSGKTGRFGLATYRTQAVFDNFRVRTLDGQPREGSVPDVLETFESGTATNWVPTDGTWTVTTNPALAGWSYRQSDAGRDRAASRYAVVPTDDFVYEADLRYLGGSGQEAILYLWGERTDYRYEVLFRGRGINDLSVRRYNTGENIIYQPSLPFAPQTGVTYRVRVARERGWLRFWMGTNDLGRVYDPWVRVNTVGLGGYRSDLLYDNVSLRPQGSGANERYDVFVGTNLFALTTVTPWGETAVSTVKVIGAAGSLPIANPGGPYAVDEITGQAVYGGWKVAFNGTNSSDAESGIATYEWDFGIDPFDGATVDNGKWLYSASTAQGGGVLTNYNGYLYSREPVARAEGQVAEARLRFSNNDGMLFGFKADNDDTAWTAWRYGLHAHGTAMNAVYDGTDVSLGRYWSIGTWYDIRIELKAGAGARFWFKQAAETNWTLAYETSSGTATTFRRGLYSGGSTTVEMDGIREAAAGATPTWRFYTPGTSAVVLTVHDQALQAARATTTVARTVNQPPVAVMDPPRVFYESNAVDRVWTIPFTGTNSTDDHGLWTYEWDWDYDGTFTSSGVLGSNVTHSWSTAGVWAVALRVTDHVRQPTVVTGVVTTVMGAPPTAHAGGPYAFTEAVASDGAWNAQFNGTNSTDAESQLVQYTWDLGNDTFDVPATLREKWASSGDAHITNGVLTFDFLSGSYDSGHYCFTHDRFPRVRGLRAETRIRFASTDVEAAFGFRADDESNTHWNQWIYGLHNHVGTLHFVENSTHTSLGLALQPNTWYDWRIELKDSGGARYYFKRADSNDWVLVRDSTYSTATSFRRGYHIYHGTFEADTYTEWAAGPTPTYRLYTDRTGTSTVTLTVWDQVLQTNAASAPLALLYGNPPVADAGPDQSGDESDATQGIWWFSFDASASTDDYGIYRYEWDWDYNGTFRPSGEEGAKRVHAFPVARVGTNVIAVRVRDRLLQSSVDTARVVIAIGSPPIAHAGADRTLESGWPMTFDGRGSTDDVEVARYAWNFGDGTTGRGPTPRHLYRGGSNYTVSLVVYDRADQASAADTMTVTIVTSTPPMAVAGGPYLCATGGPPAYLDASASTDNGDTNVVQGIAMYLWDANIAADSDSDGIPDNDRDGLFRQSAISYAIAGIYTARLTVVDGAGQTDRVDTVVTVTTNLEPLVICVPWHGNPASRHLAVSGRSARLKGVVRDAGALQYMWDFGDGTTSAWAAVTDAYALEASHVFTGPVDKPFDATLRVRDAAGLVGSDTYRLVIRPDDAATRADIAVDEGLWWMHKTQDHANGWWSNPQAGSANYRPAAASAAIQAFEMNGHRQNGDLREDPYADTVRRGFAYLFSILSPVNIGVQSAGNPDSNTNGIGIRTSPVNSGYQTGMAMDAIAGSEDLLALAPAGPPNVKHRFFIDVLTDMVDLHAWSQADSGTPRGGWRYELDNRTDADNSVSQWAAVGMLGAENGFGVNIPAFVRSENQIWLANTFSASLGAFCYQGGSYNPWAETAWHANHPSAMLQLAVDDVFITNATWRAAEKLLADTWTNYYSATATKNYYALYAAVKALRLARPRPVVTFESSGLDWYHDANYGMEKKIVADQASDGSWNTWYRDNGDGLNKDLSTAWGVMILTPALVGQPPVAAISAPSTWRYGMPLVFSARESFHIDATRHIVRYYWDFNHDGVFEYDTTNPDDPLAQYTWPDPHPGVTGDPPSSVTVHLRVQDDNAPALTDDVTFTLTIRESPLAPYADPGGPYAIYDDEAVTLDGSASFDLDPGDSITRYEWDFNHDDVPDLATNGAAFAARFLTAGTRFLGLRVADAGAFNGGTSLTSDWAYTTITVTPADADGDGMRDPWEIQYFGSTLVANTLTDYDGDFSLDREEYPAGTDPTNPASRLVVLWTRPAGGAALDVSWQSVTTRQYDVACSTDLVAGGFVTVTSGVPGALHSTTIRDPAGASDRKRFYRVRTALP